MSKATFELNKEQKRAVEAIEGPVMVIAGPGTGKTEILARRIANILQKGVSPASGILSLTFTNSGVRAMRKRLGEIIGPESSRIHISTFHSFASLLLQEFYEELSLPAPPTLIDEKDTVVIYDEILEKNEWEYLRARGGGTNNFDDIRSVISLLKQQEMSSGAFLKEIEKEIERIENDPESLSSRGKTKGELKATEKEKIERLTKTKEVATFYSLYEDLKNERNLCDYDDIIQAAVRLVKKSEDVRATLRERYLYVLVDEHQDSSGIQNKFLETVWGDVEKPNVFVVGDDRQLIFGFGGASLSHFEEFTKTFPGTEVIALSENRRSTQDILDTASNLLQSSLVDVKLQSVTKESHPVRLIEAEYPRDEIIAIGLEIKAKIEQGTPAYECAVLVPKKAQIRTAIAILKDLGVEADSGGRTSLFALKETQSLLALLRFLGNPTEPTYLSQIIIDPIFGIPFIKAQKLLRQEGRRLFVDSLGPSEDEYIALHAMLTGLLVESQKKDVYTLIQRAGEEIFFKKTKDHDALMIQIECVRTFLHVALGFIEKNHKATVSQFVEFIDRLEAYGQDIPLAVFNKETSVKVMTLHSSKGLEFDSVWIAHLDESSLMKGRQLGFTLPEILKEKVAQKDELTARRELYVGITRAKRFCTLSYARTSYSGGDQKLATIVSSIPENLLEKVSAKATEEKIMSQDKLAYVISTPKEVNKDVKKEIIDFVKDKYSEKSVPVTHLNNFFGCPWRWYFRNFLSLPEIESESLIFGNIVHYSVEQIFKDKNAVKNIPALIESVLDMQRVWNDGDRKRYSKEATPVLERFIKEYLPHFKNPISEMRIWPYRDPAFSEIEVSGKVDLIENLGDTAYVTDFKTGTVKTARDIEKLTDEGRLSDMMRQLAMYSYLLMHQRTPLTVSSSKLLFLEAPDVASALYETQITNKEIELLRTDLKDFTELLKSGEWVHRPCTFKGFGKNKECEYCAMAHNLI